MKRTYYFSTAVCVNVMRKYCFLMAMCVGDISSICCVDPKLRERQRGV